MLVLNDAEGSSEKDQFKVKLLDFLKIKDLGDVALSNVSTLIVVTFNYLIETSQP